MDQGLRVSIITVCLNSEATIRDCLESIRLQGYNNIESIIVDGGSADNTLNIVKEFPDIVHAIVSEDGLGIYDAMNKGFHMSTGQILGILNSDDLLSGSSVIEDIVQTFTNNPDKKVLYGDLVYVKSDKIQEITRYWKAGLDSLSKFKMGWMPPHPTFYITRDVFDRVGGYKNSMGTAADYEFMLRVMVKFGYKAIYLPKVLVRMRRGGISNRSLQRRLKANVQDRMAWKVNQLKPHTLFNLLKPLRKLPQYFIRK
jgi:glycosyltransferase